MGGDTVEKIIGELKTNNRSTLLQVVHELQTYEEGAIF